MNCPLSIPIPFSISTTTSGSIPTPVGSHSLSATHSGFTRITDFIFDPIFEASGFNINNYLPSKVSQTTTVWDFGDGYSLSGTNTLSATHRYNVPGVYTVSLYFYDIDGNTYFNTFTENVSVYNYIETGLFLDEENAGEEVIYIDASKKKSFRLDLDLSWQDSNKTNDYTIYVTASGSKSKAYDTKNKYAHLIPFNAFYSLPQSKEKGKILVDNKLTFNLKLANYIIEPSTHKIRKLENSKVQYFTDNNWEVFHLGSSTSTDSAQVSVLKQSLEDVTAVANDFTISNGVTSVYTKKYSNDTDVESPLGFQYFDDTPNTDHVVVLLAKVDTSNHRIKGFYVDGIDNNINLSRKTYLEGPHIVNKSTQNEGIKLKINEPRPDDTDYFSFTSTGMKEMSAMTYKRQGDKFQVFIGLQDTEKNILKIYPEFILSNDIGSVSGLSANYSFATTWQSAGSNLDDNSYTSNISSLSTSKFPVGSSGYTELSSFLYLNIDPLSAGTWVLNVSTRIDSLSAGSPDDFVSYNVGLGTTSFPIITGSHTFTVLPSTNDVETYKINEDIDYANVIKSYRFQSFLHEYDKLFDGIFTSFVGEASSSPTTFGKTIFEKIANFVSNNNDVDLCNISNLQSFYDLFNEDIDILLPDPPPELKRLYDLFSIKISKLIGDYNKEIKLSTNYYTASADARNVDLDNPITSESYTVTAYTNFVARQKFNDEYILIKPQKIATKNIDGTSSGVSTTYPLSTYNIYSNWGWPLNTAVSGASGLQGFYDFYPYTTYDTTSSVENIENSVIDFNNPHTGITRSMSSLSGDWENDGGIIYKNLDYQIRKGLNI